MPTSSKVRGYLINNNKVTLAISYGEFNALLDSIINTLNDATGFAVFMDNEVTLFFSGAPNVAFIIRGNGILSKDDFPRLKLSTAGSRQHLSFRKFFFEECKQHAIILFIIVFIIGPFLLIQQDKDFIKETNAALISADAILVGVFLVFITFFYLGREHDVKYFSEGRFYTHFKNDKYIIKCAFTSLICSIFAIGVSFYTYSPSIFNAFKKLMDFPFREYGLILQIPNQYFFAGLLTLISIFFFWITFTAMAGYYFNRIRNGIYLDAIKKMHEQYFNKDNDK